MYITSEGLVLRVTPYTDTHFIAEVYTASCGTISYLVARGKGKSSRISALFRPLSLLRLTWRMRTTPGLVRPMQVEASYVYTSLPYDGSKVCFALFLGEVMHKVLRHEAVNAPLYQYIEHALRWIDLAEGRYTNFHLVFLLRLTRFLGFFPNAEAYDEGAWFDLQAGSFVRLRPVHNYAVSPQQSRLLPTLLRMTFDTMHLFHLHRNERNELLDLLLTYYRLHVPGMSDVQAVAVLRSLYPIETKTD